jgi:hypothetical protein
MKSLPWSLGNLVLRHAKHVLLGTLDVRCCCSEEMLFQWRVNVSVRGEKQLLAQCACIRTD